MPDQTTKTEQTADVGGQNERLVMRTPYGYGVRIGNNIEFADGSACSAHESLPMDKAERIVYELQHGGRWDDFISRLPNRPDWEHSIDVVRSIIAGYRLNEGR